MRALVGWSHMQVLNDAVYVCYVVGDIPGSDHQSDNFICRCVVDLGVNYNMTYKTQ